MIEIIDADNPVFLPISTGLHRYFILSTGFPKRFPSKFSRKSIASLCPEQAPGRIHFNRTMSKKTHNSAQIVLFPTSTSRADRIPAENVGTDVITTDTAPALEHSRLAPLPAVEQCQVVLSGSYRKDFQGLRSAYDELLDLGCKVLSPSNVTAVRETDGFVYMKGEESQLPEAIEARHLDAIQHANFVWLHAPQGYVGPTASLEVGFARALGIPVFAKEQVNDPTIFSFVETIPSPATAVQAVKSQSLPIPRPALAAFQQYYRRVAIQRGYQSESPRDCLLLMVEEVGELAREIRRRDRITRHGRVSQSSESKELADIFLYVVHMANVLDVDLSKIVQDKELSNLQRFLRR
jgi:NTP pyrophosphatase (non-canonical NTP hydrolase)